MSKSQMEDYKIKIGKQLQKSNSQVAKAKQEVLDCQRALRQLAGILEKNKKIFDAVATIARSTGMEKDSPLVRGFLESWSAYTGEVCSSSKAPYVGLLKLWELPADSDLQKVLLRSKEEFRNSSQYESFSARAVRYNLTLEDVLNDGNCFFHAVLQQLKTRAPETLDRIPGHNRDTVTHETLRRLAVGGMVLLAQSGELSGYYPEGNIDDFVTHMATDRTWADGIIIPILARVLDVTIVLINSDGEHEISVPGNGDRATIYLGYQVGIHFQALNGEPNAELDITASRGAPDPIDIDGAYAAGFDILEEISSALPSTTFAFVPDQRPGPTVTSDSLSDAVLESKAPA